MSKKPEPDRLLDHNYDGIEEYDNPLPNWWLWILYATILYSVLYMLNVFPHLGIGRGRLAQYQEDVAAAEAKLASTRPPAQEWTDASLTALLADPAQLAAGKAAFKMNCVPCHREDGGGSIGPNLTDGFWIHGSKPSQIFGLITKGVPDKGMPSWGTMLEPAQIPVLAAYVMSLKGTSPPNPKPPQGEPEGAPQPGESGR